MEKRGNQTSADNNTRTVAAPTKMRRIAQKSISIFLPLADWHIASVAVGMDILLVSPIKVLARLGTIWQEEGFLQTIAFSLLRITSGCLLGIAV